MSHNITDVERYETNQYLSSLVLDQLKVQISPQ